MNTKQLSTIITLCVIVIAIISVFIFKKTDYSSNTFECDKEVSVILKEHGVNIENPLKTSKQRVTAFRKEAQSIGKEFLLPQRLRLEKIKDAFFNSTAFEPVRLGKIQKKQTKAENIIIFEFFFEDLMVYRLVLRQKIALADIALVIDDWGYNNKVTLKSLELDIPLTYAILPGLPYSTKIAQSVNNSGHEIILHLPLEPHNAQKHPLEKNTIFTTMQKDEIVKILNADMESVPNLKGMNNHMGSKATEDEHVLNVLFGELKAKNLYFLDSVTSDNSLVSKVAADKDITFIKRDIFLDHVNTKEHIKAQLIKAKNLAAEKGNVVAIGHAKELTMEVIKEVVPEFEAEGFRFVYVSEILKNQAKQ